MVCLQPQTADIQGHVYVLNQYIPHEPCIHAVSISYIQAILLALLLAQSTPDSIHAHKVFVPPFIWNALLGVV